jgi:hypothetical protein
MGLQIAVAHYTRISRVDPLGDPPDVGNRSRNFSGVAVFHESYGLSTSFRGLTLEMNVILLRGTRS